MEGIETVETPTETVETPVETPAASTAPTSYFGNDGTLNQGWQTTLMDGYKDDPSLSTVKDTKTLAKMFVDTKRMVGKDKIAIPTEKSSKEEWDEYYKIGGRPDTVEDYTLAPPEGFPQELAETLLPKDRLLKWQQRFFDAGISKNAAHKFISEFANDMLADVKNQKVMEENQIAELTSGLAEDWGAAYDQKIHLGNIAIEEGTLGSGGDNEFKERVVAKLQKDPDLTRFVANLGSKFSEGKSPDFTNVPTPSDIQTQINEIESNPLYLSGTHKQRMELAARVMSLRKKMKPE